MTVGANLIDEIPAISLKFRNELTNSHDPQRSQGNHSRSESLYTMVYFKELEVGFFGRNCIKVSGAIGDGENPYR